MFKVNNKDTRTMSLTAFSRTSNEDFEQAKIYWSK